MVYPFLCVWMAIYGQQMIYNSSIDVTNNNNLSVALYSSETNTKNKILIWFGCQTIFTSLQYLWLVIAKCNKIYCPMPLSIYFWLTSIFLIYLNNAVCFFSS